MKETEVVSKRRGSVQTLHFVASGWYTRLDGSVSEHIETGSKAARILWIALKYYVHVNGNSIWRRCSVRLETGIVPACVFQLIFNSECWIKHVREIQWKSDMAGKSFFLSQMVVSMSLKVSSMATANIHAGVFKDCARDSRRLRNDA